MKYKTKKNIVLIIAIILICFFAGPVWIIDKDLAFKIVASAYFIAIVSFAAGFIISLLLEKDKDE